MTQAVEPYFDRREQLDKMAQLILPGETLHMVLDCKGGGTGYIAITDRRLIFQDANWRKTKNVLVSVPFDRVHAVGISTGMNFLGRTSGTISVQAGEDDWAFEFRNAEKVRNAYQTMMNFVLNRDTNTPDTELPIIEDDAEIGSS